MKKIMLFSMLSMIFFADTTFAAEWKSCSFAPTGIWIKLLINFHRPRTECQSGFGICFVVTTGIETDGSGSASNLCQAKGQLNDRKQLLIEVDESALASYDDGKALPFFKNKSSITILDPYTLTDATSRALGSSTPLIIKPGTYPVSIANGIYTVAFQL